MYNIKTQIGGPGGTTINPESVTVRVKLDARRRTAHVGVDSFELGGHSYSAQSNGHGEPAVPLQADEVGARVLEVAGAPPPPTTQPPPAQRPQHSDGAWLHTRSGRPFDYTAPKPEQIDIRDIAHALGHLCRFAGHCSRFYSVAEHSVHVARVLRERDEHLARWGLLHDAHEAYVVDIPSPLKRLIPDYQALEETAATAVLSKFGLQGEMPPAVIATDRVLFQHEAAALHGAPPRPWGIQHPHPFPKGTASPPAGWEPPCWPAHEASERFFDLFRDLFPEVRP
jgi:hypothetical protein